MYIYTHLYIYTLYLVPEKSLGGKATAHKAYGINCQTGGRKWMEP